MQTFYIPELEKALKAGEQVEIAGVGTAVLKEYPARKMKHAKLGHIIDIPARKLVKFTTSNEMKGKVN